MAKQPETPKSASPQPPLLNKRHHSRAQRDADVRQRVIIGTAIVAVLSVILIIAGAAYSIYIEPQQTMATVNGTVITQEQLFRRINYERFRIYKVERSSRLQSEELLADPTSAQFFAQYVGQQQQQILSQYENVEFTTLETMIEEMIIEKDAVARGITVSDADVDAEIRRQLAQLQPDGKITQESVDATATGVADITATAAAFTPTAAATVAVTATTTATAATTDTVAVTATVATTPIASPTFAPTSTPNIFTQDEFQTAYSAFISEMQSKTSFPEADFRNVVRAQLYRVRLQEMVSDEADVSGVVQTEQQIHAAHILVATQEEAQAALARIQAGEDFGALAAELSTDTSNNLDGGDLGFFGRGMMVPEFENAAFALTEVGQISEPVQTQFGWHLIQLVEAPQERPLDSTAIQEAESTARNEAWTAYLQNLKSTNAIDRIWDGDTPRDPGFRREMLQLFPTPVAAPTSPPVEATVASVPTAEGAAPADGTAPTPSVAP